MTSIRLQDTIQRATTDDVRSCVASALVDGQEAKEILEAAEAGGRAGGNSAPSLRRDDRQAVIDLFDRQPPTQSAGMIATMACPEHPGAVAFTPEASSAFNVFFARHDIPRGAVLSQQIGEILQNQGLGPQCPDVPDLRPYRIHVLLQDDRPVDGSRIEAMAHPVTGEFYVKHTGPQRGPDAVGSTYHGPMSLEAGLSSARRRSLVAAYENSGASFSRTAPSFEGPVYRATLKDEGAADGYVHVALIPLGGTADSPAHTPDTAPEFYVERSGGFAGLVEYAGPIAAEAEAPSGGTHGGKAHKGRGLL
ncbi:MAG: hypothetical protein H6729_08085 [Deltaproteobacteria bacterium]|nr:hypothetical protein [Deltaproteobacteria bacterium]